MSIKPQWVVKILNGEKTIEIRKKFPKDYVGWVYIYCTKDKPNLYRHFKGEFLHLKETNKICLWNGKVVARFWCDKVDIIKPNEYDYFYPNNKGVNKSLEDLSCLTEEELNDYLCGRYGYATHITKLEIFDKPKEISEFYKIGYEKCAKPQGSLREKVIENYNNALKYQLTRAPQSWCYIYE